MTRSVSTSARLTRSGGRDDSATPHESGSSTSWTTTLPWKRRASSGVTSDSSSRCDGATREPAARRGTSDTRSRSRAARAPSATADDRLLPRIGGRAGNRQRRRLDDDRRARRRGVRALRSLRPRAGSAARRERRRRHLRRRRRAAAAAARSRRPEPRRRRAACRREAGRGALELRQSAHEPEPHEPEPARRPEARRAEVRHAPVRPDARVPLLGRERERVPGQRDARCRRRALRGPRRWMRGAAPRRRADPGRASGAPRAHRRARRRDTRRRRLRGSPPSPAGGVSSSSGTAENDGRLGLSIVDEAVDPHRSLEIVRPAAADRHARRVDPLAAALPHAVCMHLREAEPVPRVERRIRRRLHDREVERRPVIGALRVLATDRLRIAGRLEEDALAPDRMVVERPWR